MPGAMPTAAVATGERSVADAYFSQGRFAATRPHRPHAAMPSSIRARLLLLMMTVLLPAIGAALFIVARTYQGERDAVQRSLRDSARARWLR